MPEYTHTRTPLRKIAAEKKKFHYERGKEKVLFAIFCSLISVTTLNSATQVKSAVIHIGRAKTCPRLPLARPFR